MGTGWVQYANSKMYANSDGSIVGSEWVILIHWHGSKSILKLKFI